MECIIPSNEQIEKKIVLEKIGALKTIPVDKIL